MGLKNFSYSHTIGIASFLGRGFMNPVDVRLDSEGLLFVLSRSNAGNKDVRVSVQTLDSEYMYEFGRWGTDPGQTTQPSGRRTIAAPSAGRSLPTAAIVPSSTRTSCRPSTPCAGSITRPP